jgi:hypothetical protein
VVQRMGAEHLMTDSTSKRGHSRGQGQGQRLLMSIALFMTIAAVWDSAKVALGKLLLHNIEELHGKAIGLSLEKLRLEEAFDQQHGPVFARFQVANDSKLTIRLCDRPQVLSYLLVESSPQIRIPKIGREDLALFETAAQQDVCDRDKLLATNFQLAHQDLRDYMTDWPSMAGGGFHILAEVITIGGRFGQKICLWISTGCGPGSNALIQAASKDPDADIELLVAPVLIVLGNYVLPVIFALLGAAAFVILDFYGKVRDSMLAPRDHILSWIRLVLGSVIGACIGLFFSSSGSQAPGTESNLIGSLTLSASGVAFLAGFGVEGVFAMLETLVKRVFAGEQAER